MNPPLDSPMIDVASLTKRVQTPEGELVILDGIDLTVPAGQSLAVIGESGSGKSTLLGLMAGLDLATSGSVRLDGQDLTVLDEDERAAVRSRRVGFVFQSFQLLPGLNALENVMLPLELAGAADARDRARAMLESVGLGERLGHYPSQLSGGEQQRVALARAFAPAPRILFADEPTGNLDRKTGERVAELMFSLNHAHGATLVMVTHDAGLAGQCVRAVELEAGRLIHDSESG